MSALPDLERVGDLLGLGGPLVDVRGRTDLSTGGEGDTRMGAGRRGRHTPDADPARLLAAVWTEVVGPDAAANARPVQLRQGRLVVSTSSTAWAQSLQLMSEAIIARLNERLGPGAVERAVFRHAGWEEDPGRRPAQEWRERSPREDAPGGPGVVAGDPGRLTAEQEAALAEVDRLQIPVELREKMRRAMRAAFVRREQDSVR